MSIVTLDGNIRDAGIITTRALGPRTRSESRIRPQSGPTLSALGEFTSNLSVSSIKTTL